MVSEMRSVDTRDNLRKYESSFTIKIGTIQHDYPLSLQLLSHKLRWHTNQYK